MKILILLSLFLTSSVVYGQTIIRGKVQDAADNDVIPGVIVTEKGTDNWITTDSNGQYSIQLKSENAILSFQILGYKTEDIEVKGQKTLEVFLKKETINLDETVVIGYGTVKKSDLTGSVASIGESAVTASKENSIDGILSGRASGVMVTSTGGEPGAGLSIRIRGASSINTDVEPLYIIDGIPFEKGNTMVSAFAGMGNSQLDPLSMLNVSDIKSIEVLKDASSTAIYGSRGANGVIIITTKTGVKGRTTVSYSGSVGINIEPENKVEVLNGVEFAECMSRTPFGKNDLRYVNADGTLVDYTNVKSYDWQEELFRPAIQHNHSINVSAGSDMTTLNVSAAYTMKDGIIRNTSFERMNARINIMQKLNKKMFITGNLAFSNTKQHGVVSVDAAQAGGAQVGLIQQMLIFRPVNVGDLDEIDMESDPPVSNPLQFSNGMKKNNLVNNIIYNFGFVFDIVPGLRFKTVLGGYYNGVRTKEYIPSDIGAGYQVNGKNTSAYGIQNKLLSETTLTYTKRIKKKHAIDAVLGFTLENLNSRTESVTVQNILDESLGEESITSGLEILPVNNYLWKSSLMSFIGRVNYTYNDRYLFTAGLRADGSSKLASNNKFGLFPSAAFAWRISKERFMPKNGVLNDLKLRLSYGQTGNQSISPYSTFDKLGVVYYPFLSTALSAGFAPTALGNSHLRWETTEQVNLGLDLALFDNRLVMVVDFYNKYTYDLLLKQRISYITGFESAMNNIGALSNKGVEITFNTVNISTRNFVWESDFNISFNKNRIEQLGEGGTFFVDPGNNSVFPNAFIVQEGRSIGTMYGYVYQGTYKYADFIEFYNVNSETGEMTLKPIDECRQMFETSNTGYTLMPGLPSNSGSALAPGYAKFADLNGDGKIDDKDRTYIGRSDPIFYGGFNNTFKYKNLDLSIFLQFSYGNNIVNAAYGSLAMFTPNKNKLREVYYNCWKPEKESDAYPYIYDVNGSQVASSLVVEDGSYLRLKDLTLGYTLPRRALTKMRIANARIFMTAQNLLTFTRYSMYDPEVAYRDPLAMGWDKFSYPRSRSFLLGLNVTF